MGILKDKRTKGKKTKKSELEEKYTRALKDLMWSREDTEFLRKKIQALTEENDILKERLKNSVALVRFRNRIRDPKERVFDFEE